jgi:hypothetical protein
MWRCAETLCFGSPADPRLRPLLQVSPPAWRGSISACFFVCCLAVVFAGLQQMQRHSIIRGGRLLGWLRASQPKCSLAFLRQPAFKLVGYLATNNSRSAGRGLRVSEEIDFYAVA